MGFIDRLRKAGPPPGSDVETPLPRSVTGRGHVNGFLNLDELNVDLQGRQGYETFDRMYRTDGDVRQAISLVSNPIIAGTWGVEPANGANASSDEQEDAEFVTWALFENMSPSLRGHLREALPVLFRSGSAPFENIWGTTEYEGELVTVPVSLQLRLPRTIYRWKQDAFGNLQAIEQFLPVPKASVVSGPDITDPQGDPQVDAPIGDPSAGYQNPQRVWLEARNLVYYRIGAEGDNWEGTSLLRPAYKHWLFKDAIERMDAIAQEKESLGTPICYPPLGATTEQLDAMENILASLRTNSLGYVLSPGPKASGTQSGQSFGQGWLIEYLKPGEHGTGRDPQPSLKYHTDKIAAAFIAEFIRLGHSLTGGSRNVAETQSDPFLVGVEAVAGLIEDILNAQLVAPLIAYNRPNAKTLPRLKMSLIDNTTLSQLADFLLKLIQVGALLPDQTLEDFLRERADLPPADPNSVSERGDLDDSLRREILIGKMGGGGDAAGTNGPAGSTTGGSAPNAKGTDNKDKAPAGPAPPSGAHDALTRKAIAQTSLSQGVVSDSGRMRWRDVRPYEAHVGLDDIEDHLDNAPQSMMDACSNTMASLSAQVAQAYPKRITKSDTLGAQIHHVLDASYSYGQSTADQEIKSQADDIPYQLAASTARPRARVTARAAHATREALDAMHHAAAHAHLDGHRVSDMQRNAERAGRASLKSAARTHSVHLFNQGRVDRTLDTASVDPSLQWGFRYTAVLDRNTCEHCREADDGTVRSLDDPWLTEHMPPNPECDSTASAKGNQCRCFLIPELMPQGA